jgi:hypothetical protein
VIGGKATSPIRAGILFGSVVTGTATCTFKSSEHLLPSPRVRSSISLLTLRCIIAPRASLCSTGIILILNCQLPTPFVIAEGVVYHRRRNLVQVLRRQTGAAESNVGHIGNFQDGCARRRSVRYRQQVAGLGVQHYRQRLPGSSANCTFAKHLVAPPKTSPPIRGHTAMEMLTEMMIIGCGRFAIIRQIICA